ncbi:MAG: DNA recombination/repair protein RecA, partial [Firmicutes bacterium]|nr:DNA recombination/repair protein RecA [Bacillota bacterium]
GNEMVGSRVRVKVVKNKVAPPFKQAEIDIMYAEGISREGSLIDVAVDAGIIQKAGAWFSYGEQRLGQGRENVRDFLKQNPAVALEVEQKIRESLALGAVKVSSASSSEGE